MYQNDDKIKRMIIEIMGIENEPEYIDNLNEWIDTIGIDEVFKKVIRMYSLSLQ